MTDESEDPMFSSLTDQELARKHAALVSTARDRGIEVDENQTFADRQALVDACQGLHEQLAQAPAAESADADSSDAQEANAEPAAGAEAPAAEEQVPAEAQAPAEAQPESAAQPPTAPEPVPAGSGPGLKRLRANPRAEKTRQSVLADQSAAATRDAAKTGSGGRKGTAAKQGKSKMTDATTAAAGGKKKAAKGAKPAKAAKAPKKGKAAAKPAKKGGGGPRAKFDDGAKITVLATENPYRAGSGAHDRFELVRKSNGQTVGNYIKKGGKAAVLKRVIEKKQAKVA